MTNDNSLPAWTACFKEVFEDEVMVVFFIVIIIQVTPHCDTDLFKCLLNYIPLTAPLESSNLALQHQCRGGGTMTHTGKAVRITGDDSNPNNITLRV